MHHNLGKIAIQQQMGIKIIFMLISQSKSRIANPLRRILRRGVGGSLHSYSYISKKQLDKIEKEHGTSRYEQLKMYTKQAQLIVRQGWTALKGDYQTYLSIRRKEGQGDCTLTEEELRLKSRMWQEINGIKTLIIIQILPFSGPLLIYYIYTYPTSIPTWYSVDYFHEQYQLRCIQTQAQAVQHFQEHPLCAENLKLNDLGLEQLKQLSELLFGNYEDELTGYNKLWPHKRKEYLFHPSFSKYLVIRNIKKEFDKEKFNNPQLKLKTVEELVVEKYNRIMAGERIVFEPIVVPQVEESGKGEGEGPGSK